MTFDELSRDQLVEFKQRILVERNDQRGEGTSYDELANADTLVSDEDAESKAEGIEFSPDDFSCGVAADRDGVLSELKEWAERKLLMERYAKPGAAMRLSLEVELGIDWARKALLDHIEAMRP